MFQMEIRTLPHLASFYAQCAVIRAVIRRMIGGERLDIFEQ